MILLDMKMPEHCIDCNFFDYCGDYPHCYASSTVKGYKFDPHHNRMEDCPLISLRGNLDNG